MLSIALALLVSAAATAYGQSEEPAGTDLSPLDQIRREVQRPVKKAAQMIDSFFSNEEYEAEQNDTRILVRSDGDFEGSDNFTFRFSPRLRLRLPGTGHSLLLELEGEGESAYEDGVSAGSIWGGEDDSSFELRLRYLQSLGRVVISPEIGLGSSGHSPRLFAGGRIRHMWKLDEEWNFLLSERLRLYSDRGLESSTTFYADTLALENNLLRTTFELNWRDDQSGLSYGPGIQLFRPIDERSALALEVTAQFDTEPSHNLDEVVGNLRYRRRVIKEWIVAELAPRIMFKNDDDYSPSFGVLLRLELEF